MNALKYSALWITLAFCGIIVEFESNFIYTCVISSNVWAAAYYLTKDKSC